MYSINLICDYIFIYFRLKVNTLTYTFCGGVPMGQRIRNLREDRNKIPPRTSLGGIDFFIRLRLLRRSRGLLLAMTIYIISLSR